MPTLTIRLLVFISLSLVGVQNTLSYAAAPDDITDRQRAWFDAVDINANNNYTDNPVNNSAITSWTDKSGSANHISASGSEQPLYRHNSLASDRHGVDFDGINDKLSDANDIWTGAVDRMDVFFVATTDLVRNSALFSSTDNHYNRLSLHLPWGNSISYFDHGLCCSAPARMYGALPIVPSTGYLWHFVGEPNEQAIAQDGTIILNDGGAGVYNATAASAFTMGGWPQLNYSHNGRVFEAIFYQSTLNVAQRQILGSYLSAKWDKNINASADYADVYSGDDSINGNYDFFVGGIGQDTGKQLVGTSQGLTVTDDTFLDSDGKFLMAGVDYLLDSPTTGMSTVDAPAGYVKRTQRSWFIDTTGSGGL